MTTQKRRRSSISVFGSDFKENDLYINAIKAQAAESLDIVNVEQELNIEREHFSKLKFTFCELEMKRDFLTHIKGLHLRSPTTEQIDEKKRKVHQKKQELEEVKKQKTEMKKHFDEQVDATLQAYETALQKKKMYDLKWDQFEEQEELYQNVTATEVDTPIVQEKLPSPQKEAPIETKQAKSFEEQMNELISWLIGVEVLECTAWPTKLIYKLRLTTYLMDGNKEHTCVTIWFEQTKSLPRSASKRRVERPLTQEWEIAIIKVQSEKDSDVSRFDDILEFAVEINDVEFILREINARIQGL